MFLKPVIGDLLPPLLKRSLQRLRYQYGWFGDYPSWEAAVAESSGYQSDVILSRVRDAALQVKQGLARYEGDSVLFPEIQYSWPLLASLMHIASVNNGVLRLLDFGGSLGSTYNQNRRFLQGLPEVKWCIVEQEHFVRCGKEYFEDDRLRFHNSIQDCFASERPDAILLSSVLQYLSEPYELINEVIEKRFSYILIDRTGFSMDGKHHITLQKVNPTIYAASYPCHFFSRDKFCARFEPHYELVTEFPAMDKSAYAAEFFGFLYRRRDIV